MNRSKKYKLGFQHTAYSLQHVIILSSNLVFILLLISSLNLVHSVKTNLISLSFLATGFSTLLLAVKVKNIANPLFIFQSNSAIYLSPSILAMQLGGFPLLAGMTLFAGLLQFLLSRVILHLRKVFPPEITGIIMMMVGISLISSVNKQFFGISYLPNGTPTIVWTSLVVSIFTLSIIVTLHIWAKGLLNTLALFFGVIGGFSLAIILNLNSIKLLFLSKPLPFFSFPSLNLVNFSFDKDLIVPFSIAVIIASIKTFGDLVITQKAQSHEFAKMNLSFTREGLSKSAIGTVFASLIGTAGQATSSGNLGYATATKNFNPKLPFTTGIIFITLSFFPNISNVFISIPPAVTSAVLVFIVSFLLVIGMRTIMERLIDNRRIFLIGISLILGIGAELNPELKTASPNWAKPFLTSSISITAIVAIFLNLIFRLGIKRKVHIEIEDDRNWQLQVKSLLSETGRKWSLPKAIVVRMRETIYEFYDWYTQPGHYQGESGRLKPVRVTLVYDTVQTKVQILYFGKPIDFNLERPNTEELLANKNAHLSFSTFLMKEKCDQIKTRHRQGVTKINFLYFY